MPHKRHRHDINVHFCVVLQYGTSSLSRIPFLFSKCPSTSMLVPDSHSYAFSSYLTDSIIQWTRDWFIMHLKEAQETSFVETTIQPLLFVIYCNSCSRSSWERKGSEREMEKGNFNWYQHSNTKTIKFKFMLAIDDEFYGKLKLKVTRKKMSVAEIKVARMCFENKSNLTIIYKSLKTVFMCFFYWDLHSSRDSFAS